MLSKRYRNEAAALNWFNDLRYWLAAQVLKRLDDNRWLVGKRQCRSHSRRHFQSRIGRSITPLVDQNLMRDPDIILSRLGRVGLPLLGLVPLFRLTPLFRLGPLFR